MVSGDAPRVLRVPLGSFLICFPSLPYSEAVHYQYIAKKRKSEEAAEVLVGLV